MKFQPFSNNLDRMIGLSAYAIRSIIQSTPSSLASASRALHHSAVTSDEWRPLQPYHATTILVVRHEGKVVMIGDGQVTMGR